MASQDELLRQIAAYAGAINKHRSGQFGGDTASAVAPANRGARRRHMTWSKEDEERKRQQNIQASRNRKLDLTKANASSGTAAGPSAYINKQDRHRQLINADIYASATAARARALEATRARQQKLKERIEARRRLKQLLLEKRRENGGIVMIDGVPYRIRLGGRRLERADVSPPKEALNEHSARVSIDGVSFVRSKNGHLWRTEYVKRKRRGTGRVSKKDCRYYNLTGKCKNGLDCRYRHDPDHLTACPKYLQHSCELEGPECPLSHKPSAHNTPHCSYFLRGSCVNSDCRYPHVGISESAPVCRYFAKSGYCSKGPECSDMHLSQQSLHREAAIKKAATESASHQTPDTLDDPSAAERGDHDRDGEDGYGKDTDDEDEDDNGEDYEEEEFDSDALDSSDDDGETFGDQDFLKIV